MPIGVFVLAVAVFAQGTSEFMMSGLLAATAADFGVSLGTVGLLTSVYAVGMVLGAPTMAATAGRWPLRRSATTFLALFCLAHVVAALTTDFPVLVGTRVLAAVANAGFLATVLAELPGLVGPALIGRATAVVVSGVTVACVAGVPAGTLLGQEWGWRSAFWAVAVVSAVVLVPVAVLVPRDGAVDRTRGRSIRSEWAVLGVREVWVAVLAGVLVNAATFAAFTYLGAVAARTTGADSRWIPAVLALFGLGSFAGVTLSGRYGDRHGRAIVAAGTAGSVGAWALAAVTAHTIAGLATMTLVTGAVAFGVGSALIATIVRAAAPTAPRLAGALATTALNIGAILGPIAAGLVVDAAGTPVAALWCASAAAALAAAVVLGDRVRHGRADAAVRVEAH
ncbi:Cmx/CmrA family chloramphenicol efflux MFS transporter [Nocardia asteroides]|uniref:Cmx/CmrA family chloramphenicol efflux MFS transporter n=1 Tax=Nocardia asteroides TaxID=1824 RepID=UPI001E3E31FA|nr:Cmx/CmrA family chloramphenicol efflux MFS transporter [Nocardia asteroides]UGT56595.1 MFS transporter [Nocardia asteroides]